MSDALTSGDAVRGQDPFLLGPRGRAPRTGEVDPVGVRWDGSRHAWLAASPLGVSDTRAVRYRSALDGMDVEFQEYLAFDGRRGLAQAILLRAVFDSIPLILRFRVGRGLLRRLAPPGAGPSERQVAAGRYRADVVGIDRGGLKAAVGISCDGDPGNRVTVLCASEIALALSADESALPSASGVLTPSAAIGSGLVDGFRRAGISVSFTGGSPGPR